MRIIAFALVIFIFSCSSDDDSGKGNNIANYRTDKIGNKVWMLENFNYDVGGSKCYDNNPANCELYGRLYDWATASTLCPSGWRLPSSGDWDSLFVAIGGAFTAGTKLKATSGWKDDGNGTDDYGFSARPGGYSNSEGKFINVGYNGYWWSSSGTASYAYAMYMNNKSSSVSKSYYIRTDFHSVRCMQN